tara:strand:+ start:79963 stop:80223 length:261 start_codon:yes stop_codon:yes gene_type:complete
MLVLSRSEDESIVIGDEIEVCIVRIDGNTVRLGIKAPKAVPVHRKEVYESIKESNQAAVVAANKTEVLPQKALQKLRDQSKAKNDK